MSDRRKKVNNWIRIIAWSMIFLFLVLFIFNMLRFNSKGKVEAAVLSKNIKLIESIQDANIESVEAAVEALERSTNKDSSAILKIKYQRKFNGSVILGDSLTEGLTVYDWLNESVVFAKIGGSIAYGDDVFKSAAKTHPQNAFFAYGMNDMGNYGGDADAFIKQYAKLLKDFKNTSKNTRIYVCSISTPTEAAIKGNSSIGKYKEFNAKIEKMCKDNSYTYIDISDILPKHKDLYADDGIHAAPAYYPLWMDRMIQKAGL